jgi:S1-C subfamily serine protease
LIVSRPLITIATEETQRISMVAIKIFVISCLTAFLLVCVTPAVAFTESELLDEFDARNLTVAEKRFLQTALAFSGDYNGLLDGLWGRGSQSALERFVRGAEIDGPPANWAAVMLALSVWSRFEDEGWDQRHMPHVDISLLIPAGNLVETQRSRTYLDYDHNDSTLGYSFTVGDFRQIEDLHGFTAERAAAGTEIYSVRKPNLNITSSTDAGGVTLYTRSDLRQRRWSTVMLSAARQDRVLMMAVAASITPGRSASIYLPENGRLSRGITSLAAILGEGDESETSPSPRDDVASIHGTMKDSASPRFSPRSQGETPTRSSGTGFFVSTEGHILTNAHVVGDCREMNADGRPAVLLATEADFDLALLRTRDGNAPTHARFSTDTALLNSDITVVGYPLQGLLGGLNVTRGSVTSQKGLGGDPTRMQISAPVQPGNSGGPVLSASGAIVGIVVSKLDAQIVADAIGDIPQNVNFAIRSEIAKLFLAQNGVQIDQTSDRTPLPPEQLATLAAGYTVVLTCR